MSYILDALKQSDQKRPVEQVTSLPISDPEKPEINKTRWILPAMLVITLLALLFGFRATSGNIADQASLNPPVEEITMTPPTEEIQPPPSNNSDLLGIKIEVSAPEPVVRKTPPKQSPASTETEIASIVRQPPPQPAPRQPETIQSREQLPYWRQLPREIQQDLSNLVITVHIFAVKPDSRMVKVNGQVFRQGQQITEDMLLSEITREGIILEYKGYRFRMNPA